MQCPECESQRTVKNGKIRWQDQSVVQKYLCKACGKQFNQRTGTPMSKLRTPASVVKLAMNVRTEGLGVRATGRSFGKSHSTILRWEGRLAEQSQQWSPPAPEQSDITVEGDEVYPRVSENVPPSESEGWTIHFIERESRDWIAAQAGQKQEALFTRGTALAWAWAASAQFIRWFTDGERRYGIALWRLASVSLNPREAHPAYGRRKVWREGLEVAMQIKGSQGQKRVEWVKVEHPFTAISPAQEVHANHHEAQNSALRRRASADRRRQNLYAKRVAALQRVLDVQRLVHNWVRPHHGLSKNTTPAMAMGYCDRPITMRELLTQHGLDSLIR
jgi:transposase-like protein